MIVAAGCPFVQRVRRHTESSSFRGDAAPRKPPSYPAHAGYPVRRSLSVLSQLLWNTGSSAFADDDSGAGLTISPPNQLIGEIADGLAIDRGVIPFAHRFEIGAALLVRRAHLEAVGVQEVGGGGEHVGHAVAQIDAAVAVEIDAVFDVGRRQELRLADFAGIGADHVADAKVAALRDL